MKSIDKKILGTYLEIKKAEQTININSRKLNCDYLSIDVFILNNFTKLELYIFQQYYEKKVSLKNIAIERNLSYSYVRQVIHFSRIKLQVFINSSIFVKKNL